MAAPQIAPLPPFFSLVSGYQVVLTAISPTTGSLVAGVVVSNVALDVARNITTAPTAPPSPVTGAYTSGG